MVSCYGAIFVNTSLSFLSSSLPLSSPSSQYVGELQGIATSADLNDRGFLLSTLDAQRVRQLA